MVLFKILGQVECGLEASEPSRAFYSAVLGRFQSRLDDVRLHELEAWPSIRLVGVLVELCGVGRTSQMWRFEDGLLERNFVTLGIAIEGNAQRRETSVAMG